MKRLLIADGTPGLSEALTQVLSRDFEICACNRGEKMMEALLTARPDVMVLDLMLPGTDGLSVLHTMQGAGLHPGIVATTCYVSDYVLAALERLGVSCVMLKPCETGILAARILEVGEGIQPRDRQEQVRREANTLLLRLGLRRNLAGYRYLLEAIVLYDQNREQSITKELYPAVGTMCGGNGPKWNGPSAPAFRMPTASGRTTCGGCTFPQATTAGCGKLPLPISSPKSQNVSRRFWIRNKALQSNQAVA